MALLGLAVVACTSASSPSAGDAGDAEAGSCSYFAPSGTLVSPTTACTGACSGVRADVLDERNGCIDRNTFLGCLDCPEGCGGGMEGGCFKNVDDGRIISPYPAFTLEDRVGWVHCTQAERDRLALHQTQQQFCARDAGSD
ncbi:hypothetical protein BH11MYX4_BH11MYX4_21060 [soil metagenome]